MGTGFIAFGNRIGAATLTYSHGFAAAAPATLGLSRPIGYRAAALVTGTAEAPFTITATFSQPEPIRFGSILLSNKAQRGMRRFRAWANADKTGLLFDSGAQRVMPYMRSWRNTAWRDGTFFSGELPPRVFLRYPTHIHTYTGLIWPQAVEWQLWGPSYLPDGTEADDTQYGLLWLSDGIDIVRELGSTDRYQPGGQVRSFAGGDVVEPAPGRRQATLPLTEVDSALRDALHDMAVELDEDGDLIWVPDTDDAGATMRYGFYGRLSGGLESRFGAGNEYPITLTFREQH